MDKMTPEDKERYKAMILKELTTHVGTGRAIGMGELFVQVFGESWDNRINDTRRLRSLITELREEGIPICSRVIRSGGGYYIAAAGSELENYCAKIERQAVKKLAQVSRMRKLSLPALMGQLSLDLRPKKGVARSI